MEHFENSDYARLSTELRLEMGMLYGPLLGGEPLLRALGQASVDGLRQARHRGQVAVPLFTLPKRRGYHALTRDVADWLAAARLGLPWAPSTRGANPALTSAAVSDTPPSDPRPGMERVVT